MRRNELYEWAVTLGERSNATLARLAGCMSASLLRDSLLLRLLRLLRAGTAMHLVPTARMAVCLAPLPRAFTTCPPRGVGLGSAPALLEPLINSVSRESYRRVRNITQGTEQFELV